MVTVRLLYGYCMAPVLRRVQSSSGCSRATRNLCWPGGDDIGDCMQKRLSSVLLSALGLWLQQLRKDEKAADRLKTSEESVSKDSGEYGERGT